LRSPTPAAYPHPAVIRAIQKAILYDRCPRCTKDQRVNDSRGGTQLNRTRPFGKRPVRRT
jgi:hypothetical protein